MKSEEKRAYLYRGLTAFGVFVLCALFFFLFYRIESVWSFVKRLISVLQPIIFGFVIAYLVNPIVNILNGRLKPFFAKFSKNRARSSRIANAISVGSALLLFAVIIFTIIYLVIPQFFSSVSNIITVLPGQIDLLSERVMDFVKSDEALEKLLIKILDYEKNWLQTDLALTVNKIASNFANGVWSVITFLKNFVIGLMLAVYLLADKATHARRFRKLVYACFSRELVDKILSVLEHTHSVFSGFINGKLLDSLIIGILCLIGVSVMRMPYAMLVAVIVGVTNIIPVFGPYIGAVPCAALILLTDPLKGLYFIIFIILLQTLDGNIIGPKILGNKTGLDTFWVIFAIVVGGGLFGVLGMLVGVPAFAVLYYVIKILVNNRLRAKKLPCDSASYGVNLLSDNQQTTDEGENNA